MAEHNYCRFCHPELSPIGHNRPHTECECRFKCVPCAEKQRGAEVLAACISRAEAFRDEMAYPLIEHAGQLEESSEEPTTNGYAAALLHQHYSRMKSANVSEVFQLQPAASDLEEYVKNLPLSEIARIKGIPGIAKLGKTYDRPDFYATEDE